MNHPKNSSNVSTQDIAGPWPTKSGGELSVLFNFDIAQTKEFVDTLSNSIGGLRAYRVTGLKKNAVGANEWHKVRTELAFVTRGSVTWSITEQDGTNSVIKSNPSSNGVLLPPNTMHTYRADEDDTELLVITNTSFDPNDSSTHDTYTSSSFPHKV